MTRTQDNTRARTPRAAYSDDDVRSLLRLLVLGVSKASISRHLGIPYQTINSFARGRTRASALSEGL